MHYSSHVSSQEISVSSQHHGASQRARLGKPGAAAGCAQEGDWIESSKEKKDVSSHTRVVCPRLSWSGRLSPGSELQVSVQ